MYDSKTKLIQKTTQLPTLINEPTLKTIRPFLVLARFITGNLVTNVKLKNTYVITKNESSIMISSNATNAPRKKHN